MIPSPIYSLSVTFPPTLVGGTLPSSQRVPSKENVETVGFVDEGACYVLHETK